MGRHWVLAGLLFAGLWACDDDDEEAGPGCVPGASAACACVGGGMGAQICQADNTFGACVCEPGDGGLPGADAAPDRRDAGGQTDARPAEPDAARPADAAGMTDAAATADAGPVDAQVAPDQGPVHTYVAGWQSDTPSNWARLPAAMGLFGLEAGQAQCRFMGADHVCDYTELLAAAAGGELENVPVGTTAWVQRTTPALVNGVESAPGQGGNCVDWTFDGNHLADGEYAEFTAEGVVFHLDDDTFYDGADRNRAQVGLLECGGVTRALFCCNPLP